LRNDNGICRAIVPALAILGLLAPAAARPCDDRDHDFFTVAVLSDTQNYVDSTKPQPASLAVFEDETRYLARNKRELKLAFVTHVGDVVQHGDGTNGTPGDATFGGDAEWLRAVQALDILVDAGVPFSLTPGNHDYDNYSWASGSRPLKSAVWRTWFGSGSELFAGKPWYGGASDRLAVSPGLSSWQTFTAGGRRFLHIALEMEAGDPAIAWAQAVIDAHPGYATIITTHEYLNPPADADPAMPLEVPAQRIAAGYLVNSPGGWNDAQGVWDKLVRNNDQVFMVVCGHASGATVNGVSKSENLRLGMNDFGHTVIQVLTDFQNNTLASPGGDGWLRFMRFDMTDRTIHFTTYSPTLAKTAGQDGELTFGQLPEFSDFTLPLPVQVTEGVRRHHDWLR
jgi:hypothetical protein